MKAVGIKQFKAHLSQYIRLAKVGETIFVTEREEVVAELRPARRQVASQHTLDDVLDQLAESGAIERAAPDARATPWTPRSLGLPRGTADRLLDAVREDR